MSNSVLQVGDRVVVVPRSGSMASVQISGRVLAAKGTDALRVSWDLDGRNPFEKGDEFLVIGRDIRRRGMFMSGDATSANLVLREAAGDGRSNRRFARVESLLKFSWRSVHPGEVDALENGRVFDGCVEILDFKHDFVSVGCGWSTDRIP